MNTNLKISVQFGIATGCGFCVTLNLVLIGLTWPGQPLMDGPPDWPLILALVTGGITVNLAIVTFASFVAGAFEWAFRRKRVSEAEVEKPI